MKELISEIKKSVVFLGQLNEKREPMFYATGFLVQNEGVFFLITAKHVVRGISDGKFTGIKDENLRVFFNTKDNQINNRLIKDIKDRFDIDWIFHKDDNVDIAVIPFGLDINKDDVKVIPNDLFLTSDKLLETYDIFFLSFQPGIKYEKISPVFRVGTISLINNDGTFYIDACAFPGNSGSPVFLKPLPIRFDESGISIGGDELGVKFIGIVGSYLPYTEVAVSTQTGKPRVIFEENTGLSHVWSTNFIREILDSDKVKEQTKKIGG